MTPLEVEAEGEFVAGLFEGDTTTAWTPSASLACDATADTVPPPPRPKTTPKKRAKKAPHTASVAGGEYEIDYTKAPEHWDLQVALPLLSSLPSVRSGYR